MTETLKTNYVKQLLDHVWAFKPNRKSFGGVSYLIVRERGSLLVDAPIFDPATFDVFDELAFPTHIFVTHRDDVAEVDRFREKYGIPIIIHESENDDIPGGADITFGEEYALDDEVLLLHTPGHSPGSSSLLWKRTPGYLFTGDHVIVSRGDPILERFSWTTDWKGQIDSGRKLLTYNFQYIFSGHGGRQFADDAKRKLKGFLDTLNSEGKDENNH